MNSNQARQAIIDMSKMVDVLGIPYDKTGLDRLAFLSKSHVREMNGLAQVVDYLDALALAFITMETGAKTFPTVVTPDLKRFHAEFPRLYNFVEKGTVNALSVLRDDISRARSPTPPSGPEFNAIKERADLAYLELAGLVLASGSLAFESVRVDLGVTETLPFYMPTYKEALEFVTKAGTLKSRVRSAGGAMRQGAMLGVGIAAVGVLLVGVLATKGKK